MLAIDFFLGLHHQDPIRRPLRLNLLKARSSSRRGRRERKEGENMEFDNFGEIRLLVEDGLQSTPLSSPPSSSSLCLCRICHEEEEQDRAGMESPCSCSGTLKFAHRECIQRWCDQKGSIICEICLKKFEPGYTVNAPPAKLQTIDVVITIRGSLEAARINNDSQSPAMVLITRDRRELENAAGPSISNQALFCFQSLALMFTAMFLLRHLAVVLLLDSNLYTNTLSTVFLRCASILLASLMIVRLISAIRNAKRNQQFHEREVYSIYQESADDIEQQ